MIFKLRFAAIPILLARCISAQAEGPPATPVNVEACRACHGPAGISLNPTIPNLAGQKPAYLEAQLKAFRSQDRKNDFMNVIAAQLDDPNIHDLAAYWSGMSADQASGHGPVSSAIHSRMQFPHAFPSDFRVYQTEIEEGILTRRFANTVAVNAARAGKKLPDGSVLLQVRYTAQKDAAGNDVAGPVQSYAGMESHRDWGNGVPALLRNENWDYALFAADGKRHDELNEAPCLACHKPKESDSYVFTLKQLREAPPS